MAVRKKKRTRRIKHRILDQLEKMIEKTKPGSTSEKILDKLINTIHNKY